MFDGISAAARVGQNVFSGNSSAPTCERICSAETLEREPTSRQQPVWRQPSQLQLQFARVVGGSPSATIAQQHVSRNTQGRQQLLDCSCAPAAPQEHVFDDKSSAANLWRQVNFSNRFVHLQETLQRQMLNGKRCAANLRQPFMGSFSAAIPREHTIRRQSL